MAEPLQSGFSRVFLMEDRAGPNHAPIYEGLWRAQAVSWGQGDITLVYEPSSTQYNVFNAVDSIKGEPSNPTLAIQARYTLDLSAMLRMARRGCENDLQVHMGKCRDPRDFNGGWDKVLVLEAARLTDYGTDELGALQPDQKIVVNENTTFTGTTIYEVGRITFAAKAGTEITQEIVDVTICDSETCGACGLPPSNGCNVIFALTLSNGGSPGAAALVVYSQDGGLTWATRHVDTLAPTEDPDFILCAGLYVIVGSNASKSIHYILITDLLEGTGSWTEQATGINANGEPNAGFNAGPTYTWYVGDGGYVYFTEAPQDGCTVQDAGSATSQDLLAIHGASELVLVAVGKSNAVITTIDGGTTWQSITGPAVGVQLNAVWCVNSLTWFVGTDNGKLYYTTNAGLTWAEKSFPGSGAGKVYDIVFSSQTVGYMAHTTAGNVGRVLRTINGGYSWYVAPEGTATTPTNQKLECLAVCEDVNVVYAGGATALNGDGILIASA